MPFLICPPTSQVVFQLAILTTYATNSVGGVGVVLNASVIPKQASHCSLCYATKSVRGEVIIGITTLMHSQCTVFGISLRVPSTALLHANTACVA